ncbi:MAG TPA: response regulator, partial [Aggregatilineales bacterium]|nr:response regulator [Aggregatilineales bacterium]
IMGSYLPERSAWDVVAIDDDTASIGVVGVIFEFAGIGYRSATDGQQGLALLRERKPNLVLLDLQMADFDGYQVLKTIREDAALADLVVIALTAHAKPEDRESVLRAGFDGYLTKPIAALTFLDEIPTCLQVFEKERQYAER